MLNVVNVVKISKKNYKKGLIFLKKWLTVVKNCVRITLRIYKGGIL
jgi:hypothetical protein